MREAITTRSVLIGLILGLAIFLSGLVFWSQLPNNTLLYNDRQAQFALDTGQTNPWLLTLSGFTFIGFATIAITLIFQAIPDYVAFAAVAIVGTVAILAACNILLAISDAHSVNMGFTWPPASIIDIVIVRSATFALAFALVNVVVGVGVVAALTILPYYKNKRMGAFVSGLLALASASLLALIRAFTPFL